MGLTSYSVNIFINSIVLSYKLEHFEVFLKIPSDQDTSRGGFNLQSSVSLMPMKDSRRPLILSTATFTTSSGYRRRREIPSNEQENKQNTIHVIFHLAATQETLTYCYIYINYIHMQIYTERERE